MFRPGREGGREGEFIHLAPHVRSVSFIAQSDQPRLARPHCTASLSALSPTTLSQSGALNHIYDPFGSTQSRHLSRTPRTNC